MLKNLMSTLAIVAAICSEAAIAADFDQGIRIAPILGQLKQSVKTDPANIPGVAVVPTRPDIDMAKARAVAQRAALTFYWKSWGGKPRCDELEQFRLAANPRKIEPVANGTILHCIVRPYPWLRSASVDVKLQYSTGGALTKITAEWQVAFPEPPMSLTVEDLMCPGASAP
jgi:hypothetical protein